MKKLNYKLFSRTSLERRCVEKEFKAEELKVAETGKILQMHPYQILNQVFLRVLLHPWHRLLADIQHVFFHKNIFLQFVI